MKSDEEIRFRKAIWLADIRGGEKVLDLGCGPGKIRNFLPKVEYMGVDLKKYNDNIVWNLERGLPPEVRRKKFDVIFMNEFIEHIENFKTLLIQCKKSLKPKGRIIIDTPSHNRFIISEEPTHIHCFRKTNMENLARMCGLKIVDIIGSYIRIPILHIFIPTSQTFYSDVILYRLERK